MVLVLGGSYNVSRLSCECLRVECVGGSVGRGLGWGGDCINRGLLLKQLIFQTVCRTTRCGLGLGETHPESKLKKGGW